MFLYMMDLMMYAVKHLEARQHLHLIQTEIVTIYFTSQTGKQYSYKVDSIKTEFNMLANVKGFADERNGVAVSKDSARKANIINFKIIETGEDYDVLADAQRYQLTFYKALNNKVTFNVEK